MSETRILRPLTGSLPVALLALAVAGCTDQGGGPVAPGPSLPPPSEHCDGLPPEDATSCDETAVEESHARILEILDSSRLSSRIAGAQYATLSRTPEYYNSWHLQVLDAAWAHASEYIGSPDVQVGVLVEGLVDTLHNEFQRSAEGAGTLTQLESFEFTDAAGDEYSLTTRQLGREYYTPGDFRDQDEGAVFDEFRDRPENAGLCPDTATTAKAAMVGDTELRACYRLHRYRTLDPNPCKAASGRVHQISCGTAEQLRQRQNGDSFFDETTIRLGTSVIGALWARRDDITPWNPNLGASGTEVLGIAWRSSVLAVPYSEFRENYYSLTCMDPARLETEDSCWDAAQTANRLDMNLYRDLLAWTAAQENTPFIVGLNSPLNSQGFVEVHDFFVSDSSQDSASLEARRRLGFQGESLNPLQNNFFIKRRLLGSAMGGNKQYAPPPTGDWSDPLGMTSALRCELNMPPTRPVRTTVMVSGVEAPHTYYQKYSCMGQGNTAIAPFVRANGGCPLHRCSAMGEILPVISDAQRRLPGEPTFGGEDFASWLIDKLFAPPEDPAAEQHLPQWYDGWGGILVSDRDAETEDFRFAATRFAQLIRTDPGQLAVETAPDSSTPLANWLQGQLDRERADRFADWQELARIALDRAIAIRYGFADPEAADNAEGCDTFAFSCLSEAVLPILDTDFVGVRVDPNNRQGGNNDLHRIGQFDPDPPEPDPPGPRVFPSGSLQRDTGFYSFYFPRGLYQSDQFQALRPDQRGNIGARYIPTWRDLNYQVIIRPSGDGWILEVRTGESAQDRPDDSLWLNRLRADEPETWEDLVDRTGGANGTLNLVSSIPLTSRIEVAEWQRSFWSFEDSELFLDFFSERELERAYSLWYYQQVFKPLYDFYKPWIDVFAQAELPEDDRKVFVLPAGDNSDSKIREVRLLHDVQPTNGFTNPINLHNLFWLDARLRKTVLAVVAVGPEAGEAGSPGADFGEVARRQNVCGDAAQWCLAAPGTVIKAPSYSYCAYPATDCPTRWARTATHPGGSEYAAALVGGALAILNSQFQGTLSAIALADRLKQTAAKGFRTIEFKRFELAFGSTPDSQRFVLRDYSLETDFSDSATYGQGLLDLRAALSAVGRETLIYEPAEEEPGTSSLAALSKHSAPLDDSLLGLYGSAFGDGLVRAMSGHRLMALDELQAPFFHPLSALADWRGTDLMPPLQHLQRYRAPAARPGLATVERLALVSAQGAGSAEPAFLLRGQGWEAGFAADLPLALLTDQFNRAGPAAAALRPDSPWMLPWLDTRAQWRSATLAASLPFGQLRLSACSTEDLAASFGSDRLSGGASSCSLLEYSIGVGRHQFGALAGTLKESRGVLGLRPLGALGTLDGSTSTSFGAWGRHDLAADLQLSWTVSAVRSGETNPRDGILRRAGELTADSFALALGLPGLSDNSRVWLQSWQPLRVRRADVHFRVPVARNRYREIFFADVREDLAPSGREIRTELMYDSALGWGRVQFLAGRASEPGHIEGAASRDYLQLSLYLPLGI